MTNNNLSNRIDIRNLNEKTNRGNNLIKLSSKSEIMVENVQYVYKPNGSFDNMISLRFILYNDDKHSRVVYKESLLYKEADFHDARKKFVYPQWLIMDNTFSESYKKTLFKEIMDYAHAMNPIIIYDYALGYNHIGDHWVYNAGDRLIYSDRIKPHYNKLPFRLVAYAIDERCLTVAQKILRDDEAIQALFISSLLPLTNPLISSSIRSRYDPVIVIRKNGESFATEYCKIFSAMYVYKEDPDRPYNMLDLDSNQEEINGVSRLNHCLLLLDSLRQTGAKDLDKTIKLNAATVINRKSGVNNSVHNGVNDSVKASLMIIADCFFDKPHMNNRCIFIRFTPKVGKNLTWYQENLDYLLGLKLLFIQYILGNFSALQNEMKTLLKHYSLRRGNASLSDYNAIMSVTLDLFILFYKDTKSKYSNKEGNFNMTHDDSKELPMFHPENSKLFDAVDSCIEFTRKEMEMRNYSCKYKMIDDFLETLIFNNPSFITRDFEEYIQMLDNELPEHFVYYDKQNKRYLVRAKHLEKYFMKKHHKYVSYKCIPDLLAGNEDGICLIETEGQNRTIHALKSDGVKKRFISIKKKQAEKYVKNILS